MFETSPTTAKLDEALAKAQGEIEAASKDKVNPAFKSRYADLTSVWTAIRPALSKHGISATQWLIHSDDSRLHIITRLAHGGEWMRAQFSIPVDKSSAHGYGSATTYAKRFALSAALGVVADEDDDGNAAATFKPASNGNGTVVVASKARSREPYSKIVSGLRQIETTGKIDDLRMYWTAQRAVIAEFPEDWRGEITAEKDRVKAVLESGADADTGELPI